MRLHPRHYLLIAVIVGIGIFNIVRARRSRVAVPVQTVNVVSGPVAQSPAWSAFDHAAGLRDAAEEQFSPALQTLQQAIATNTSDPTLADVKGCQTWLLFYRQGVLHPARDTSWKARSTQHLDTCVKTHQDAG